MEGRLTGLVTFCIVTAFYNTSLTEKCKDRSYERTMKKK